MLRGPARGPTLGHAWGVYLGATRAHALWAVIGAILKSTSGAILGVYYKIYNLLSNYYSFIDIYYLYNLDYTSDILNI